MVESFRKKFIEIFEEGLKPFGFKPLKNSDIFVRAVNNEILQFIYPRNLSSKGIGGSCFSIETSVRSIYMSNINCSEIKSHQYMLYQFLSDEERSITPWQKYCFYYNHSNVESVIENVLHEVIRLIIPVYNGITTLSKFMEYSLLTNQTDLSFSPISDEFLVWIAVEEHLDIGALTKALMPKIKLIIEYKGDSVITEQALQNAASDYLFKEYISPLNEIKNDPSLLAKANAELEMRKKSNTAFLIKSGICLSN